MEACVLSVPSNHTNQMNAFAHKQMRRQRRQSKSAECSYTCVRFILFAYIKATLYGCTYIRIFEPNKKDFQVKMASIESFLHLVG